MSFVLQLHIKLVVDLVKQGKSFVSRVVNVFIFFKNYRFIMKTMTKIEKRNDRFLKKFVFKTLSFLKQSFLKSSSFC